MPRPTVWPRTWVQQGFPWSPHPVPALPHSPRSLSPAMGPSRLPTPYLPWGRPGRWLLEEPCSVGGRLQLPPGGPPACWECGQPLRVSWPTQRHGSGSVLQDCPSVRAITHVLLLHRRQAPGLCRWDPGSGGRQGPFSKPRSGWTAQGCWLGLSSSGRGAVWEEGRWEGSDVAKPPLPLPVPSPSSLPSPARRPPAVPDQWTQMPGGGPILRTCWVVCRGPGPVTGGAQSPQGLGEAREAAGAAGI